MGDFEILWEHHKLTNKGVLEDNTTQGSSHEKNNLSLKCSTKDDIRKKVLDKTDLMYALKNPFLGKTCP